MKKLAITAALVLFVSAGAAQPESIMKPGSTPGNLLYGLDRASESVEVRFAGIVGGQERAAKVRANHAEERLAEAQQLADQNRTEDIERLMNDYNRNMNAVRNASVQLNDTEFTERVQNMTQKHVAVLERVQQKVPEQAQKGIQNALENSKKNLPTPGQRGPPGAAPSEKNSNQGPGMRPGNQGPQPFESPDNTTSPDSDSQRPDNQTSGPQSSNTSSGPQA